MLSNDIKDWMKGWGFAKEGNGSLEQYTTVLDYKNHLYNIYVSHNMIHATKVNTKNNSGKTVFELIPNGVRPLEFKQILNKVMKDACIQ